MMLRSMKPHRSVLGLVMAAALLAAAPASVSAQQPIGFPTQTDANTSAHRLVGNNNSLIALYMYPASTLDRADFITKTDLLGGEFELLYRFHYKGNGLWNPFYGEQYFRFDRNGRLLSTRNGLHNTSWAPGAAVETFLNIVRGIVRARLDPSSGTSQAAMNLIDQARVRDVLELLLRSTQQ